MELTKRGSIMFREGFLLPDLITCLEREGLRISTAQYTFGNIAMQAHTLCERFRGTSNLLQALSFPFLIATGILDSFFLNRKAEGFSYAQ